MELQLLDLSNYPIGGSYCIEQSNLWPWNSFLFEQLSKNTLHSHLEPSEILNSQLFGETWCPSHAAAGDGSSLHCFSPPHCPGELSEGCEAWQELQPCAPSSSWAQRQRFCIFLWQFPPIQSDQRIGGRLHTCLTTEKEICWGKNVCFYSSRGVNLPMFIWEWCVSRTHRLEMLHALLHHPIIRRQLERSGCLKKGECLHFLRDGCATVSTVSSETPQAWHAAMCTSSLPTSAGKQWKGRLQGPQACISPAADGFSFLMGAGRGQDPSEGPCSDDVCDGAGSCWLHCLMVGDSDHLAFLAPSGILWSRASVSSAGDWAVVGVNFKWECSSSWMYWSECVTQPVSSAVCLLYGLLLTWESPAGLLQARLSCLAVPAGRWCVLPRRSEAVHGNRWLLLLFGVAVWRQTVPARLSAMQPHNCLSQGREFISSREVASDPRAAGAPTEQTVAEYSTVAAQAWPAAWEALEDILSGRLDKVQSTPCSLLLAATLCCYHLNSVYFLRWIFQDHKQQLHLLTQPTRNGAA